ncbi:MAG: NACHT domain-containing protein [Waterburya sp.]
MTGIEIGLIELAKASIGGVVVKTCWDEGKTVIPWVGKGLSEKTQELIYQASGQYAKNYCDRHGILKVLGMREPVSLESIYTAVQLLSEMDIGLFRTTEALEETFRNSRDNRFNSEESEKQDGITIAKEKQYLTVLGAPGSGKSTFLRKIGLEAFKGKKGNYQHSCIPVVIELKKFTEAEIDLEKIIVQEFSVCNFPKLDKNTTKLLENGKLLILLDGLDEVPTKNLNNAIEKIQDFVDKYDKNRFIISCRTAAYRSKFRRFNDVIIAEFDNEQIEQFINNWFSTKTDEQTKTAYQCWKLLQKLENRAAKELAKTPLLLTFLCLVYDKSQNFPKNRSVLYKKALRILLEEWAAEKRINRDEIYEGLHTELEEILLSEIAVKSFEEDRLFFAKKDVVAQIKTFLSGNLNAPQHLNGAEVLKAIAVQQGILVERAEEIFSFSHLTLQEYLTAQYIVDHNRIEYLVLNHLTDPRWKEVFLLVAGLMNCGADDLLLLMEKQARNYLDTPTGKQKLVPLLRWAHEVTKGSQGDLKSIAKKALAYAFANALANAFANTLTYANANVYANDYTNDFAETLSNVYANTYANALIYDTYAHLIFYTLAKALADVYANTYANALNQLIECVRQLQKLPDIFHNSNYHTLITQLQELETKIPDKNQPEKIQIEFAQLLINNWLGAFHLNPEILNLSEEEIKEIDQQYFYINRLIVQCQETAVRISPQTWSEIEDRMLLPVD